MSYWNKLLTKDNFFLAWKRINTGTNIYYKRFFREVYLAYEISHKSNIENLLNRIKGGSFKPCEPDKIFIPKPSGLQRPITLLTVEDQIVWQAIANFLMDKFYEGRKEVEGITVFSNLHSSDKKYFFKNWKSSYSDYRNKIYSIFKEHKWVVHFDLAAFFDTISHDHIINLINPKNKESEIAKFVEKILRCWTSENKVSSISHGVPQGPIASSFIGELIFLEIDLKMKKHIKEFSYLRYVDDIRLLAKNE
ncbi:MAG: hypothetical protein IMZ60_01955 [Actinobacteria bacterium]|nr:hypothetical protein [Actinomycetota bacterium]